MTALDAKRYALALLRGRLAACWPRGEIEQTTYEGAGGPGLVGYLMSAGKISVPSCVQHGAAGTHTFPLGGLLDEIEGTEIQRALFAL